jgi:hypothetical protein
MRTPSLRLALALACVALPACASRASMDSRYEASLQRWQGATRAELVAAWGAPRLAQASGDGAVLTWVVRTDIDSHPGPDGAPVVMTIPAGRAGGTAIAVVTPGAPAPAGVPITCTTRFVLKNDRVESWKFEGLGCGAPY